MASWTDGQLAAREQLEDIAEASGGQITIESAVPSKAGGLAEITISVPTGHLARAPGGLPVRQREQFVIAVPAGFPRSNPDIYATHSRFAGFPHVQWARKLCLYQAPQQEYAPADGMFGFIDRLNLWLQAAALNELDPEGAPLHAPAVYANADERFVIRANAPSLAPDAWHWTGAARLNKVRDNRLDIIEWSPLSTGALINEPETDFAAAVILNRPLPFEYPTTAKALFTEFEAQGYPRVLLAELMSLFAMKLGADEPLYLAVGSPSRRREAGSPLRPHCAIWRVPADQVQGLRAALDGAADRPAVVDGWSETASMTWCRILEAREELTVRRDRDTPASSLRDKRILLLGCGALGGPIAEAIVRAGATRLDLADYEIVKPGILVRQSFNDHDIGHPKAGQLRHRLNRIGFPTAINVHLQDLGPGVLKGFSAADYDLIIDATASNTIARTLEQDLASTPLPIPLISVAVSARAEHGMLQVRMPDHGAGPVGLARKAKLEVLRDQRARTFANAFWPVAPPPVFQPEPGCSEPTFLGSAADMQFHASAMLDVALARISSLASGEASIDFISKPSIARAQKDRYEPAYVAPGPLVLPEPRQGGRMFIEPSAEREIHSWIARGRRKFGSKVETGGLMFGGIDESLKTAWLDSVTGPPPDSEQSAEKFICGVRGTQETAAERVQLSGGSSRFVGIWHTHPVSMPQPSVDDLEAMYRLLVLEPNPPRAVLMLIVGYAATNPQVAVYLYRRREFQRRFQLVWRRHG